MNNILFYFLNGINPERGGVERVCSILSHELTTKGWNVYSLSSIIDTSNNYYAESFVVPNPWQVSKENRAFIQQLVSKYDIKCIVGEHCTQPSMLGNLVGLRLSIPILCHYHTSPQRHHSTINKLSGYRFANTITFQRIAFAIQKRRNANHYHTLVETVDKIILLSKPFIKEINSITNIPTEKTLVIPNPNTYSSTTSSLGNKEKLIVWVGRISEKEKRISSMLSIWKKASTIIQDWSIVIVGGGDELDYWKRKAEMMHLERCTFVGFTNPDSYYKKASIYAMTSNYEGWGMTVVEAMSNGCAPVVFDSYASVHDIIDNNINGILVRSFDDNLFAKTLINLANDNKRRENIAKSAIEKSASFSNAVIVQQWHDLLIDMCSIEQDNTQK